MHSQSVQMPGFRLQVGLTPGYFLIQAENGMPEKSIILTFFPHSEPYRDFPLSQVLFYFPY